MFLRIMASAVLLLLAHWGYTADIVRDVSAGRINETENGGYFELGLNAAYNDPALRRNSSQEDYGAVMGIAIGGAYRYNGWFVEASQGTFDGLNFGYIARQSQYYSVDLIIASVFGEVDTENVSRENIAHLPQSQRSQALLERDTLYSGAGIRTTFYWQDYILQLRLVEDIYDEAGFTSTIRLATSKLYKNWNLHAIASAEFNSAETLQYLYGIDAAEATPELPAYKAGSGFSYAGEIGATYPISKNWVYRTFLRLRRLPTEASNSPLADSNTDTLFYNSISYVF